jgi:hypothetical protein
MLEILKQPDHEGYEEYQEWLPGDFDPGYCNLDMVNNTLLMKNFGIEDDY